MESGKKAVIFAVLCLVTVPGAYCWGPLGHQVVARFAEERLTARAQASLRELLGPEIKLQDVATWADDQREIAGSEKWHYINIPISAAGYQSKFCPPAGCIVSKIKEFSRTAQDSRVEKSKRIVALKFLIHLVADIHQPLHVGDNGDRGGNLLQVRFFGVGTNLHSVWDSKLMERYTSNKQVWLWEMTTVAHPAKAAQWATGTPEDWANETLAVARQVYCVPGTKKLIRPGAKLQTEYYSFAFPILREQLAKAGIRLAYVLNEIFR